MSNSKTYYIRTDLGEFKVSTDPEKMQNALENPNDNLIQLETLTGFKCQIRNRDIKICGLLDNYMSVLDSNENADGVAQLSGIADLKFFFSRDKGDISIVFLDDKGDELARKRYDSEEFVSKIVNELPNAVLDAIIEEQDRRSFS